MIGQGKYDKDCEELLLKEKALLTMVCVIGGTRGSGFSVSSISPQGIKALAMALEGTLATIKSDLAKIEWIEKNLPPDGGDSNQTNQPGEKEKTNEQDSRQ